MTENFIDGNKEFIETDFVKNHNHYENLANSQHPKTLWIGCSDSRVDPERITKSNAGELFVHRNVGNIVSMQDPNFASVLEYAVKHLHVSEIVVCGHAGCGAMGALDSDMSKDTHIPGWIDNAREAKLRVDARISEPKTDAEKAARKKEIELENIRLQLEHLRTYQMVSDGEKSGSLSVQGLYYDLHTGMLSTVE